MRLIMTSEMRDEYSKKLGDIYNDYSYSGTKTNIPERLLNNSDYKKNLKGFLKDLVANNISNTPKGDIVVNFEIEPEDGEPEFDDLIELAKDYLIAIDLKRSRKERLYPEVMQIPTADMDSYREDLLKVMISNEMVKQKMTSLKWLKVWANQLNKWDKVQMKSLIKSYSQKSGIAGAIEKSKNSKAVKKQNPSPTNALGLNEILNKLTDGKNLIQLTPQVFKAIETGKAKSSAPKVNQNETEKPVSESTTEEE